MGLIKSIFGAIFGLIGGIFKAVGGLVGLGKKSEYYLEADGTDGESQPAAAVSDPMPAAKTEAAPVKAEPQSAAPAASAKSSLQAAPAPAPVAAGVVAEPAPSGFASTYLTSVGSTTRRRRPGPSLSPFLDMAKQVKAR